MVGDHAGRPGAAYFAHLPFACLLLGCGSVVAAWRLFRHFVDAAAVAAWPAAAVAVGVCC